jgi:aryl-alcohol dehydrogenase-like predicted oxidoreductase
MTLPRRTLLAGLAAGAAAPVALAQQLALIRKPIPSSGEMIPVIGLGSARRYEDPKTEAELAPLRETFRRFQQLGGKVVDTAPSYGNAEAVMGGIMGDLGIRNDLFVCTKVGVNTPEEGRAQIAQSFQKLRTERIDLIAVHNLRDITNQLAYLRELSAPPPPSTGNTKPSSR